MHWDFQCNLCALPPIILRLRAYTMPLEVHLPMELHSTTVKWENDDTVTVWDKTQGVKSTQQSIMNAFKLEEKNVKVNAQFVGGGFGSALRTWPHVIAALIGAKKKRQAIKTSTYTAADVYIGGL